MSILDEIVSAEWTLLKTEEERKQATKELFHTLIIKANQKRFDDHGDVITKLQRLVDEL